MGGSSPSVRTVTQGVALLLPKAAACCWWLTLLTFTLNAGWYVHGPGRQGASYHLFLFDLPMLATIGCWTLGLVIGVAETPRLGPRAPICALGGLIALSLAGVPAALHPDVALGMAVRVWLDLAFYLYTVNLAPDLGAVAIVLSLSLAVQGAVAFGQVIRQHSLGLGWLGERLVDPATHGIAVVTVHGHRWLRPYGLTLHPNLLGGIAACSLVLLAGSMPRRLAIPATAGCLAVLGLTLSRGAWLAGGTAVVFALLVGRRPIDISWRRVLLLLALAGALMVALMLVTPARSLVAARFDPANALEQQSIGARLTEQGEAWQLIAAHPLLGVGANGYLAAIYPLLPPGISRDAQVPVVHNAYLLAAAEIGILGPALLAVALLAPSLARLASPAGFDDRGAGGGSGSLRRARADRLL